MSASVRNLEHVAQVQSDRAEKAERQAEDLHHALNLLLNSGFQIFHSGLTADGAIHRFELGAVRGLLAFGRPGLLTGPSGPLTRRIVLWTTMFPQGHLYASAFHEPEFRLLPSNLELESELRNLLEQAIEMIPMEGPFLIKDSSVPIQ